MNINELMRHISALVGTNPEEALRTLEANEAEIDKHLEGRLNKNGFLIDIGSALSNKNILLRGLEGMSKVIAETEVDSHPQLLLSALYNFANGFSNLSSMERKDAGGIISPDNEFYQTTKEYYRTVFDHSILQDDVQNAKICINYANALSSMGRSLEAIKYFEEAIKLDPNNPLGFGNLGVELAHHYRICGDSYLLLEAEKLISQALSNPEKMIEIGGAHVQPHYQRWLEWVRQRIKQRGITLRKLTIFDRLRQKWRTFFIKKPSRDFLKMCNTHELFLNFSIKGRSSDFIGDNIFPYTITAGMEDDITIPRLLRTVNEIKERYATARLSLFEALKPQFDLLPYEELTYYADTFDDAAYGLRVAKVKFALENAFNVLDKIAFFLDYYLRLVMKEESINFSSIWTERIGDKKMLKKSIESLKNSKLMALYDLSLDLIPEGYLYDLRKSRNTSTHRYLLPHVENLNIGEEIDGKDYHLMYEELTQKAIKILQIARAAVIYMIAFIDEEEGKKRDDGDKRAPVIYPPYIHHNFNPLNPWDI